MTTFARGGHIFPFLSGFSPGSRILRQLLRQVSVGCLAVETPSAERLVHQGAWPKGDATLVLHRWRGLMKLLTGGDIGLAEAYVDGDWSSPDLTALLTLAAENIQALDPVIAGKPPARLLQRLRHVLHRNTKTGSRRNIAFHYDLGNAFYERWLDTSMTYSSALYTNREASLEEAQQAKLARIVDLLDIQGGERVLEIGCGWGALAEHLTRHHCCSVTGLTLSNEQLVYAQARMDRAGLASRADLRLEDYRDATGVYDRVVSIEMIEAVGERYWSDYFRLLRQRLKPGARAVLQVITISEERFATYRRSPDFIQRYIFPGGMLPTRRILRREIEAAGLRFDHEETFGESYARTLAEWRERFHAAWPAINQMGFDQRFHRLWDYYLAYCEAGFRAQRVDVSLVVLHAPEH